jgi:hypothetical protein
MKEAMVSARSLVCAVLLALSGAASAVAHQAPQEPSRQPPTSAASPLPPLAVGKDVPPISAGQIQRWFEAFTVLQAQDALQLSEAQYGRFVTRLKALQETRRKHQQARNQVLGELRRLTNPEKGTNDEASITERLKALREEDDRASVDMRKAYDAVDEMLDIRQQARFRLFEEKMEQQKLELLTRARANARAAARDRGKT